MCSRPRRFRRRPTLPAVLALVCAAGLALAAPAGARTFFVSGHQIPAGQTTLMRGGLLGTWTVTDAAPFELPVSQLPLMFRVTGTESFVGCLNRHRDWSCRHDPKGTLTFYMDTWGLVTPQFTPEVPLLMWGACVHPVTSGDGAFKDAQGVITMIDTYTPDGVYIDTRYDGNIILPDKGGAAAPPQGLSGPPAQSSAAPLARAARASHHGCGTA
jgi:hypothetical protein